MHGVTFKKPKRLEEETVSYLRQLEVPLQDAAEDEEQREILVENCFKELRMREASACCNKKCSFVVEKFLAYATTEQLLTFVNNTIPYIHAMMYNPYASHVLQRVLEMIQKVHHEASDPEASKQGEQLLNTLVTNILDEHFPHHMCNPTATHVVRSSWGVLAGLDKSEFQDEVSKGLTTLEFRKAKTSGHSFSDLPQLNQDMLKEVVSALESRGTQYLVDMSYNPYGAWALGDLMRCLAAVKFPKINSLFRTILGLQKGKSDPGHTIELANSILSDRVVECIIQVCSDAFFDELFQRVFKGNMQSLGDSSHGNYVLQQALACCRTSEQAELFVSEMTPLVRSLLAPGMCREGVVVYLVALAGRLGPDTQRSVEEAIHDAFKQSLKKGSVQQDAFAKWLLDWGGCRSNRKVSTGAASVQKTKTNQAVISGAAPQIVKAMLSWIPQISRRLLLSLASFEVKDLITLAKDAGGSRHVIEPLMTAPKEYKWIRQKLLAAFRGHWDSLAADKFACWGVQKAFDAASRKYKTEIATELADRERKLSANPYGKHALRHCRIEHFRRDAEGWLASFEAEGNSSAVKGILDDVNLIPQKLKSKPKQEKKKGEKGKEAVETKAEQKEQESSKADIPVLSSQAVDPFMSVLGFGGQTNDAKKKSAKTSKKEKKEKKDKKDKKEKSRKRQKIA